MKPKEEALKLEAARARVMYDPDTGAFYSVRKRKAIGYIGHKGYIRIDMGKNWFSGHRLAWFLTYGAWPEQIDHMNGNKADNRIANLRDVDRQTNAQNQREASANNPTGFLGVSPTASGRFRSQIRDPIGKCIIFLGTFDTAEEAHAAYVAKKIEIHPGYATGGDSCQSL